MSRSGSLAGDGKGEPARRPLPQYPLVRPALAGITAREVIRASPYRRSP